MELNKLSENEIEEIRVLVQAPPRDIGKNREVFLKRAIFKLLAHLTTTEEEGKGLREVLKEIYSCETTCIACASKIVANLGSSEGEEKPSMAEKMQESIVGRGTRKLP